MIRETHKMRMNFAEIGFGAKSQKGEDQKESKSEGSQKKPILGSLNNQLAGLQFYKHTTLICIHRNFDETINKQRFVQKDHMIAQRQHFFCRPVRRPDSGYRRLICRTRS